MCFQGRICSYHWGGPVVHVTPFLVWLVFLLWKWKMEVVGMRQCLVSSNLFHFSNVWVHNCVLHLPSPSVPSLPQWWCRFSLNGHRCSRWPGLSHPLCVPPASLSPASPISPSWTRCFSPLPTSAPLSHRSVSLAGDRHTGFQNHLFSRQFWEHFVAVLDKLLPACLHFPVLRAW